MLDLGFPSTGHVNIFISPPATKAFSPLLVASTGSLKESKGRSRKVLIRWLGLSMQYFGGVPDPMSIEKQGLRQWWANLLSTNAAWFRVCCFCCCYFILFIFSCKFISLLAACFRLASWRAIKNTNLFSFHLPLKDSLTLLWARQGYHLIWWFRSRFNVILTLHINGNTSRRKGSYNILCCAYVVPCITSVDVN